MFSIATQALFLLLAIGIAAILKRGAMVHLAVPAILRDRMLLLSAQLYAQWLMAQLLERNTPSSSAAIASVADLIEEPLLIEAFKKLDRLASRAKHAGFHEVHFSLADKRPQRAKTKPVAKVVEELSLHVQELSGEISRLQTNLALPCKSFPENVDAPPFIPSGFFLPSSPDISSWQALVELQNDTLAVLTEEVETWRHLGSYGGRSCSALESQLLWQQLHEKEEEIHRVKEEVVKRDRAFTSFFTWVNGQLVDSAQQRFTISLAAAIPETPAPNVHIDYVGLLDDLQAQANHTNSHLQELKQMAAATTIHLQDITQSLANGHPKSATTDPVVRDVVGFLSERLFVVDRKTSLTLHEVRSTKSLVAKGIHQNAQHLSLSSEFVNSSMSDRDSRELTALASCQQPSQSASDSSPSILPLRVQGDRPRQDLDKATDLHVRTSDNENYSFQLAAKTSFFPSIISRRPRYPWPSITTSVSVIDEVNGLLCVLDDDPDNTEAAERLQLLDPTAYTNFVNLKRKEQIIDPTVDDLNFEYGIAEDEKALFDSASEDFSDGSGPICMPCEDERNF